MDDGDSVLLKTFDSEHAASLAANQLRSNGIECLVTTDDAGGMYPPMGVIKLLVASANAAKAREILQLSSAVGDSPVGKQELSAGSTASSASPPRVYRFNAGVVVGVILGALLHFGYTHYKEQRDRTDRYYNDADEWADEEIVWRNGESIEGRVDQNGDGRWDGKTHLKNGVPVSYEVDDNFDGKWDGAFSYSARGFVASAQLDTDFNGIPDMTATYEHGIQKQSDWKPNGTNVVLLRQLFRHGVLDEELRDVNGDGWFDVSVKFDPFAIPIRTNNLRPTTQSP